VPATTYANWFSYTTDDFISENREIRRAIDSTRRVFPRRRLRFVGDSGLDDKKIFEWIISEAQAEFVIRASHLNRRVEVYNRRPDRWESEESLEDLVRTVPFAATWQVTFKHAGKTRLAEVKIGWLHLRLPLLPEKTDQQQELWAVVAEEHDMADKAVRTLVLLSSVPVVEVSQAQELYEDWRLRGKIEHGYRFCQEQGLDVEDMRVRSVERMRRLFILVLLAAQFVMHLMERWPPVGVGWLRLLGGKLGLQIDRDGPYQVLRGLSAVWQTVATLTLLSVCPFPHDAFT
jgi:Transposase DDE domain